MRSWLRLALMATAVGLVIPGTASRAASGKVHAAVAANFTAAAKEIGARFERQSGYKVVFSFGSTGQLYAQITQGAPFDVYLAADQTHPEKAVKEGFAVPGSRFTYATGRLVLYSKDPSMVEDETSLKTGNFTRIAVANPVTAPYGAAAIEVMRSLGVYDRLAGRIVQGDNVTQAYQFIETGNAELGFVALSQVAKGKRDSRWVIPDNLYSRIAQEAVLLEHGVGNAAARAFMAFLAGPEAGAVKAGYGYGTGDSPPGS